VTRRVSAVVPAYREAERVADTVAALSRLAPVDEVIVVDDGSPDETAEVAREAGAIVVRLPRRKGKAGAVAAGLAKAAGEVLLLVDADLGTAAHAAEALLDPVLDGRADVAVAVFPPGQGGGGFGLVKRHARAGIRALTGRELAEPLSGQRAFRREVLAAVGDLGRGFELEVVFSVRALWAGYRLLEVPVPMRHRGTGRDLAGFLHRAGQYLAVRRALRRLAREGRRA
jgi:glycosyltransferase involved in cell wall biosynthesis